MYISYVTIIVLDKRGEYKLENKGIGRVQEKWLGEAGESRIPIKKTYLKTRENHLEQLKLVSRAVFLQKVPYTEDDS